MNRFLGKGLGCLHLEGHPSDPVRLRAVVGQHQRDRMNGIVADVVPSRAAGITFSSELGNRSARRVKKLKDQAIFSSEAAAPTIAVVAIRSASSLRP